MDAPDEMVEAVARAARTAFLPWAAQLADCKPSVRRSWEEVARAVLSVPALADVIARDAKVREIVERWDATDIDGLPVGSAASMYAIAEVHLGVKP